MKRSRDALECLRTRINARALSVFAGLLLFALGGYTLLPRALSVYHQGQASQILQAVLQTQAAPQAVTTFCHPDLLTPQQRQALGQASAHLSQAIKWHSATQAHLLSGRVACLLGNYESAVSAYDEYTQLRPQNPLGALELGLALTAWCQAGHPAISPAGQCPEAAQLEHLWQQAGVDFETLPELARKAFQNKNFADSYGLYQLNEVHAPGLLAQPDLFAYGLSAILAGQPQPESSTTALQAARLTTGLRIEAEDLQWLRADPSFNLSYGDRLGKHSHAPEVGIFWWNGTAIALLDVAQAGRYHVTLRAQDTPPAPILLDLELNLEPVASFELSNADDSWQDLQAEIEMPSGLQIIGVRFKNDASIDGVPRDAVVDWLEIQAP
ncbi:MAG: hypothetical protein JW862_17740 [Anaerolineales bacterium]|nr:hypothetical protein [Anaerolineales bacterium]